MFDFSFGELMVTAAVALVVIGPEKLPKVARTVGALLGRAQRHIQTIKQDLHRDMQLDELRQNNPLDELQRLSHELQTELKTDPLAEPHTAQTTTPETATHTVQPPPAPSATTNNALPKP